MRELIGHLYSIGVMSNIAHSFLGLTGLYNAFRLYRSHSDTLYRQW